MIIKTLIYFRALKKISKTILYKLLFRNMFRVNIAKSYLSLTLSIIDGVFTIGANVKNKSNMNVSINNGHLCVGDNVFFNNYVSLNCRKKIFIGNNCLFGENVYIYDHNHKFKQTGLIRNQGFSLGEVVIGSNVWIGSNTVILPNTFIGDNVVIAAGSIVKGHIPEGCLYLQKRKSEVIEYENMLY